MRHYVFQSVLGDGGGSGFIFGGRETHATVFHSRSLSNNIKSHKIDS
jgi:hypothetical protein